jgi:hypothetical protein
MKSIMADKKRLVYQFGYLPPSIMLLNWRKCEKEGKTHFKFDQCMGEWGACVVTSLLKPKNTFFITLFSLLQSQSVLFYFCIITRLNIRVCDFFKIVHNLNIEARSSCVLSVCAFFCINIMKRTTSHIAWCSVYLFSCLYLINSLSALELPTNYVKASKYKITFHLTINCSFDIACQCMIS